MRHIQGRVSKNKNNTILGRKVFDLVNPSFVFTEVNRRGVLKP